MMGVDRPPVASKCGVSLRSASFFVNELTGADDDLMVERLCHDGDLCLSYELLSRHQEQNVTPASTDPTSPFLIALT
jgi:hypothetical protein